MKEITYTVIRSRRRTLSLQISPDGKITVRAPMLTPAGEIREFVTAHRTWILRHLEKIERTEDRAEVEGKLSLAELQALADRALKEIPPRVRYWANLMGVSYGRITIRNQKTRWGSCSSQGNLNFNCLLMLTPQEVIDSVIVHELCHRKHMDHSPAFYAEVRRYFPEYDTWNKWLKKNGPVLMKRMTG